jgi:hypothetical protein
VFIAVRVYFVIDSVRKLLNTSSYKSFFFFFKLLKRWTLCQRRVVQNGSQNVSCQNILTLLTVVLPLFSVRVIPSRKTIYRLVRQFEETEIVCDKMQLICFYGRSYQYNNVKQLQEGREKRHYTLITTYRGSQRIVRKLRCQDLSFVIRFS